ncbi:MAG: type II secretion system secretin GspD [Gammaproteobacteria bacterium]
MPVISDHRRVPPSAIAARRLAGLLALVLLLAVGPAAVAQGAGEPLVEQTNGGITLNLRDADIRAFIASVAEITGHNFIVDPRVKGKVTVISSAPTNADGLYDVFLSILRVHGFTAVASGDVVKIIPDALGKQEGRSAPLGEPMRANDGLTTAVIPLEAVNAAELVAILRPLLPQEAHLAGFQASNTLVVADTGANVRRLMGIVRQLDVESSAETIMIELRHAGAESLVGTLNAIDGPAAAGQRAAGAALYVAYPRTNTIIVRAEADELPRIRALIAALDSPDRGPDEVEVIRLKFAVATDLLPVLQGVIEGGGGSSRGGAQSAEGRPRGAANGTSIQADEATNSLIVQAPAPDLRRLKEVIAELDVRRGQVLVEAIIAELTTDRADELGIQWRTDGNSGWEGGTFLPGTSSGPLTGATGEDGALGLAQGLTLGYISGPGDIRFLLRALANDRYTNVLSTPTLMTLDNAEAEIVVGQNVPFVTGQFTNQATTPENPFQTIQRQDVGVILRVKPQINYGDTVTLELEQEVSSVDASTSGADLITNERSIRTTVLVDDKDIVVLGGLIENEMRENAQKVPLFGDLPVIGQLFRNNRGEQRKTNLMVFLRPSIVRTPEDGRREAEVRYESLLEKQEAAESGRTGLLKRPSPRLPAFDGLYE